MGRLDRLATKLVLALCALVCAGGAFFAIDAWTTMETIKAQGVIGQAVYMEQYNEAADQLQIAGAAAIGGLAFVLVIGFEYVGEVLTDLAD